MATPSPTVTEFSDIDHEETDQSDVSQGAIIVYRDIETSMKLPDIKPLRPGVFQLEEGYRDWDVSQAFVARITLSEIHTEPRTKKFGDEDHVSLTWGLESTNLETIWVSDEGKYIDTSGDEQDLVDVVLENLVKMRIGEKDVIEDIGASRIYVVKLETIKMGVEGPGQSLLASYEANGNASQSRALAAELSPGSWELACAVGDQGSIQGTIRNPTNIEIKAVGRPLSPSMIHNPTPNRLVHNQTVWNVNRCDPEFLKSVPWPNS